MHCTSTLNYTTTLINRWRAVSALPYLHESLKFKSKWIYMKALILPGIKTRNVWWFSSWKLHFIKWIRDLHTVNFILWILNVQLWSHRNLCNLQNILALLPSVRFRYVKRYARTGGVHTLWYVQGNWQACRGLQGHGGSRAVQGCCRVRMGCVCVGVRSEWSRVQNVNVLMSNVRHEVEILLSLIDAEETFRGTC